MQTNTSCLTEYLVKDGTLKVSGSTDPTKLAIRAISLLETGKSVEFVYIGASAGHQATKAMTIFKYMLEAKMAGTFVCFSPSRSLTNTTNPTTNEEKLKDCSVWAVKVYSIN